ncbi:MAG TPA: creatininase family protein [Steroidobacteraceae bacterium]|jgi:creatinine amidohydrolase|nr:creatininase family protein [Steroidobacteraceae bacterium]
MSARDWWDLTTEEFSRLDAERTVALLPVCAVEQHGPHLPVRVDAAINAGILARAVELMPDESPLLVLPAQNVGKSDEHTAFAGTLTINYETLGRLWFDLAQSVHRAGCRRIIFFNSHGGQPQLIDIVCRELRVRLNMLAVNCAWFNVTPMSDLFDAAELQYGIHGGAVETSIMLHLHPGLVKMDRARHFVSRAIALEADSAVLRVEGATSIGWQTQDLNQAGACGDATAASAALGKELVERAARALAALVADVARYAGMPPR